MSDFHDIAQKAIEKAKALGAQNAVSSIARAQNLDISWRKGKIENMSSSGESGLNIQLYVDGKYGSYGTSDLRPDSIDAFIKKAIDMTRLLEEDPARTLPDPERYKDRAALDLELYDAEVAAITPNKLIEMCGALEAECAQNKQIPIIDIAVEYGTQLYESYMVNTNGFEGERKSSNIAGSCEISMQDGDKKPSNYGYSTTKFLADLRSPKAIADEAVRYCSYMLKQKKLESKNRTVVLDPRVSSSMISKFISPLFTGSLVMKKSYFLDKIDQVFGAPLLDLRDMPFIKRGASSALFDGEGMSCKEATIFEAGKLKQYYLSTYGANKLGLTATSGRSTNLVLTPGKRSLDEIIADVKDGIYIFGLLGGNSDEVRGDFSHGFNGVAIEDGKLTTPVSEMNITGNHLELWKNLVEAGNDPRVESSLRIPSLRFDNVATSGT